jgi:ATP dependent DNA ligase domain
MTAVPHRTSPRSAARFLAGDTEASARLHYVAFDLLAHAGEDLRGSPWRERHARLRDELTGAPRVRVINTLPATPETHAQLVALGFEGSVLKQPGSAYRPGRQRAWLKHKARHELAATLQRVFQDHDGVWHGICQHDDIRLTARAGPNTHRQLGGTVTVIYSRLDADGTPREARIS